MAKRLSVTLGSDDVDIVARFGTPGSVEHEQLRAWAEGRGLASRASATEANLLRMLMRVGAQALAEQSLDSSYAQLAVELDAVESDDTRAHRDRYAQRTDRLAAE